jgi:hypothetical protein
MAILLAAGVKKWLSDRAAGCCPSLTAKVVRALQPRGPRGDTHGDTHARPVKATGYCNAQLGLSPPRPK